MPATRRWPLIVAAVAFVVAVSAIAAFTLPSTDTARPSPTASIGPSTITGSSGTPAATPSPSPTPAFTLLPTYSASPSPWVGPTPVPTPLPPGVAKGPTRRVATRIQIAALDIDLPVIRQKTTYPACNVAMYLEQLKQPGQGGSTYLYAHARTGMFLPLLEQSKVRNGARMIGMTIKVWTGDSMVFTYRITQVRRHIRSLDAAFRAHGERLWLQTSEGPNHTYPKLQVLASFVSSGPAAFAEAHPKPHPVRCG